MCVPVYTYHHTHMLVEIEGYRCMYACAYINSLVPTEYCLFSLYMYAYIMLYIYVEYYEGR